MIRISVKKRLSGANGFFDLDVSGEIKEGSFLSLNGKSGSGKTTLLRILAGLEEADSGQITVDGQVWLDTDAGIVLKPQKRAIGFVFQDYSLFPNMTVRKNIAFACESDEYVEELLDMVELRQLAERYPSTLSGGQQQRVALARAVARKPKILLLDEPLSALDRETRTRLQDEILRVHDRLGITTIMVSHDIAEMFKLTNRMWLMKEGRVLRDDTPGNIYSEHHGSRKFSFVGELLALREADVLFVATVAVGSNISEVVLTAAEAAKLRVGDRVMIASKAFNPIVQKIEDDA